MTTFFILAAVYVASLFILRKMFVKHGPTDIYAFFLTITPVINTVGFFVFCVIWLADKIEAKFKWSAIAKRFFGK